MSSPRVGLRFRVCVVLATTALTSPLASWAQISPPARPTAPGTTAPELSPAARLPRPAPRRSQDIFQPEPPGPCPLADSDVQVTVTSVTFQGATALEPEALRGAYAEYLDRPQPVSVVCAIRDRAARMLFDRGILARVEIPEQRIAGGALTLEVIEAHVINVRVRGDIGPAQEAVERYVERLRGMKPFDMQKAQRFLLLASDIPGVNMRAAIRPSTSGERGAVDIDVSVTRDAYDAVVNAQNLGSKVVGRWGGLVRGEADSFTRFGEATSLTAFRTIEANEQWLVQAATSGRFGGDGWIGRASGVYGESRPGGLSATLGLKSTSIVANTEASYPLLRTRTQNLNLTGGFDYIDQKSEIAGLGTFSRDHLRVFYARADGDSRTDVAGWPVQLFGAVTVRKGVSGLSASDRDDTPPLSREGAKPDAWLVRGAGSVETPVGDRLVAAARVQGQYSGSALVPYEQISLGSLTVGRGYDPAAVLGDSGISGAFEMRYGAIQVHPQVQASPYAFMDVGYVRNNNTAGTGLQRDRTLRSVGAGVAFRVANRANVEFTVAQPLDSVAPGVRRKDTRVLVQLTASLF